LEVLPSPGHFSYTPQEERASTKNKTTEIKIILLLITSIDFLIKRKNTDFNISFAY